MHYGRWLECEPESVREFSAAAYYFGRDLEKRAQGSGRLDRHQLGRDAAESYTSLAALDAEPSLRHYAERAPPRPRFEMDKKLAAPSTPTVLYNSMTHPLIKFPVRGRLVPGRIERPRPTNTAPYPVMIKDWRARWKSELPFMGVQLAPFQDDNSNGVRYAERATRSCTRRRCCRRSAWR